MKLTSLQEKDLETVLYFIPELMKHIPISNGDIKMFFENSEKGLHKEKVGGLPYKMDGFNALLEGKSWRGVHMRMYEEGVLDGTMPYFTILGGYDKVMKRKWWQFWKKKYTYVHSPVPRAVVDFMKKEMFKGADAVTIERCYQTL